MTVFSDEDLKRLKEEALAIEKHGVAGHYSQDFRKLEALLARLKASEACIKAMDSCHACGTVGNAMPEYEAWKKAAGKND